jgi:hypothetical protein
MVPMVIRLTLVLLVVAAFGAPLTNSAQTAPPITGVYAAEGTNSDGRGYRALVLIREHEDAFRVQWLFPSRRAVAGLGILNGDVLAVSYFGSTPGIVAYEIEGDRLVGRWTVVGAGGELWTETLTRIPGRSIPVEPAPGPAHHPGLGGAVLL